LLAEQDEPPRFIAESDTGIMDTRFNTPPVRRSRARNRAELLRAYIDSADDGIFVV
jgi:hypothetical protein